MSNFQGDNPELQFDDKKSFKENTETFLGNIEKYDPEMGIILRENWDALIAVVSEGERDSKARVDFNAAICTALEKILLDSKRNGGE